MPDPTDILLKIDAAGYEVSATVIKGGTVMEAVHRQTGDGAEKSGGHGGYFTVFGFPVLLLALFIDRDNKHHESL